MTYDLKTVNSIIEKLADHLRGEGHMINGSELLLAVSWECSCECGCTAEDDCDCAEGCDVGDAGHEEETINLRRLAEFIAEEIAK